MPTTLALIADWFGPYPSVDDAREAARAFEVGEALYMAMGKRAHQRNVTLQYVGISSRPTSRLNRQHHALPEVTRNLGIWVGEITSQSRAGRRASNQPIQHSLAVYQAEWALAYFLQLPLNTRKRRRPPDRGLILLNRWFQTDWETRRIHRGHKDWPDFIEYEPDYDWARLQWFGAGGRMRRFSDADIKALALEPNSN